MLGLVIQSIYMRMASQKKIIKKEVKTVVTVGSVRIFEWLLSIRELKYKEMFGDVGTVIL